MFLVRCIRNPELFIYERKANESILCRNGTPKG